MDGEGFQSEPIVKVVVKRYDREELLPKRGAVSIVWRFFGFKRSDVAQTTIYCKCCRSRVVAKGGSTSNLLHHLSRRHVAEYQQYRKLQGKTSSYFGEIAGGQSSHMSYVDVFANGAAKDQISKWWTKMTDPKCMP